MLRTGQAGLASDNNAIIMLLGRNDNEELLQVHDAKTMSVGPVISEETYCVSTKQQLSTSSSSSNDDDDAEDSSRSEPLLSDSEFDEE